MEDSRDAALLGAKKKSKATPIASRLARQKVLAVEKSTAHTAVHMEPDAASRAASRRGALEYD